MKPKPKPLYLENLATTLRGILPADLLKTQFSPYLPKPQFEIAGEPGRNFQVRSSGWGPPNGGNGTGWGEALSGFGASEIEFDIRVTDLHWRVRVFYRDNDFVGLQYEAEPWEREYIIPGSAICDRGLYTLGESFYTKAGGLRDDAVESLYNSVPPQWWVNMNTDYPWPKEREHMTKSVNCTVDNHANGTSTLTIAAESVDGKSARKTIGFIKKWSAITSTDCDETINGEVLGYDVRVYFKYPHVEDIGKFAMKANPYSGVGTITVVHLDEDECIIKARLYHR